MRRLDQPGPRRFQLGLLVALTAWVAACGDSMGMDDRGGANGDDAWSSYDTWGGEPDFVEEPELAYNFLAPKASRDYVFVPNETLDTVSKIDADSLAITSIPVCDRPTRLEAVERLNLAVVLCQGSDEVALVHADAPTADLTLRDQVVYVDVEPRMNNLALSPDGRYAFAYFSFGAREEGEPIGSLQTLSLIRTDQGEERVAALTAGFQVRQITFRTVTGADGAPQATHAFIITDTGVSVVALAEVDGDAVLPVIQVSPYPLADPLDREVYVTPSGEYAVVRDLATPELFIVRLSDGEIQTIALDFSATDVDIVPVPGTANAAQDRAIVVIREGNEVLDIPVAAAFDDPEAVTAMAAGDAVKGLATLGGNGRFALLYTTLGALDELTVVDLRGELPVRVIPLRKAISGAAISSDGGFGLVLHPRMTEVDPALPQAERLVAERPGYSIVDLETGFTRLVLSEVPADEFTFWDGELGAFAYVTFNDADRGVMQVDRIALDTFAVSPLSLGSPPSDVGRVTGRGRIWVNQEHPVGRMTFIEVETGAPKTVTGFELNRLTR